MQYLLDANVFIAAKNLHYGFDFCPAFWDWLVLANGDGKVFSIEKVYDELLAGDDALSEWAKLRSEGFFLRPNDQTLTAMGAVSAWVTENGFTPAAVNTFLQIADYYLVSEALSRGLAVVTHERPANTINKVKIPNVCIGLHIRVLTPYEMLRAERARFILGGGQSDHDDEVN